MFNSLHPWLQAIIVWFGFFLLSQIVIIIFEKIFWRWARKTETDFDDQIIRAIKKPLYFIVLVVGLRLGMERLNWQNGLVHQIENVLKTFVILFITLIAIRVVNLLFTQWQQTWYKEFDLHVDTQLIKIFHRFSRILFSIVGVLFILDVWGIEIGPFLASLGIAGIAVAFALQKTLADVFGGVSLVVDRSLRVGDVVSVDNDTTKGKVVDVGLRSTKIETFDHQIVIVPNSLMTNSAILNYGQPDPTIRIVVPFGVAYGTDVEKVRGKVLEELKTLHGFLEKPGPLVRFLEMGESSLNFKAYFYIGDYTQRLNAVNEATTKIYNLLQREGIEIPFPQMDVHVNHETHNT